MPGHDPILAPNPPARPGDPIDLHDSVAGEEDPGASIDLATPTGTEWNPGDEAPAGTPGTGEDAGPRRGGTGGA